jgi:hypothetical protein
MINNSDQSKRSTLMEKIRWIGNEGFDETFESVIVKDFKDFKPIQVDSSGKESTFNYGVSQKMFEDTIKNSDNFVDLIQKLILSPIECGIFSHKLMVNLFIDKDNFEVSLNNEPYIKGIDEEFQFESKLKIGEVEITSYPFRELLRGSTKDLVELKKLLMSELKDSIQKRFSDLLELQLLEFQDNKSLKSFVYENGWQYRTRETNWEFYNQFDLANLEQKKEMSLFFYEDNLIKTSESFQKIAKSLSEGLSKEERIHLLDLLKEEIC